MIVTGTSRAAPEKLAEEIMAPGENKRVEILELQSPYYIFASGALRETLRDWQVFSELTRGDKGLYHAQICPAPGNEMTPAKWTQAVDILTEELGLQGYPRATVLHDDGQRPYLHVVWQRTNLDTVTLWSDAYNYNKHERASRRMEREFGHAPLPERNVGYSRAEARQARRTGVDLGELKVQLAALKATAESPLAFTNALEATGYLLAAGDSGYVLVDRHGGVYSLARHLNLTLAEVNEFMAPVGLTALPTVETAKARQKQFCAAVLSKGAA